MADGLQYKTSQATAVKAKTKASAGGCPHCHGEVPAGAEICPHCGWKLVSYCTFCGADMAPSDSVCPDCGMPAEGVECPNCGTHNHRSFCRKCGTPLTKAALREIERAKADPKLLAVMAKMEQLLAMGDASEEDAPALSEGAQQMMELLGIAADFKTPEARPEGASSAERAAIIADINAAMADLLPPAGSTPQQQRVYYTARKVAVMEMVKQKVHKQAPIGWVCNYCGCTHPYPEECVAPELGGRWIYGDVETTELKPVKTYK